MKIASLKHPLLLGLILGLAIFELLPWPAAAAQESDEIAALEQRAEESFADDDLETAITLYRQLADRQQVKSEKLRVMMTVASVEHLAGRAGDARATLVEVLVLDPGYRFQPELYDEGFRELFYAAQKQALTERAALASQRTREANEHLRQGDLGLARQSYEAALAANPDHPNALYNLALVNLRDRRRDEAEAGFQRLLALAAGGGIKPTLQVLALNNLGVLYSQRQQYEEAENAYRQAAEIDPQRALTWYNLGDVRRHQGKKDLAAEAFRQAYELDPEDPDIAGGQALSLVDRGELDRAALILRQATARHGDNATLWLLLGRALVGLGDVAAVASLEQALTLDPQNRAGTAAEAAIHLAIYHHGVGDHRRTLVETDRALGWRSDLVDGWAYQGLARRGLGDLGGALESFDKARTLDPTQAEIHNNRGIVLYELGRLDEAREACERALEIDPGFDDARRNLDIIHQAGGRPRTATAPPPPPRTVSPPPPRTVSPPPPPRTAPPPPTTAPPPPTAPARPSGAPRTLLGMRFSTTDYSALGIKGAMVEAVRNGSPADRAGIRKNDLILGVDGEEVGTPDELLRYVEAQGAGKSLVIELLRSDVEERLVLRTE